MHPASKTTLSNAIRACIVIAPVLAAAACTERPKADPANAQQVAAGKRIYGAHCASCHGANLEGQPNWRQRLPNGRFPAPPHDASGHTWHHPDVLLLDIIKRGIGPHAPPGYQSDMPAFGGRLSDDEIAAVLAYIKSTWPEETRKAQASMTARDAPTRR
jgi:S-disulfanyl-L-cysteine oxidoreductase SoxD